MVTEPSLPTDGDEESRSRRRAAWYVVPLIVTGLILAVLLLGWGLNPLWAFAILPPIVFLSAIAWVAFQYDFEQ